MKEYVVYAVVGGYTYIVCHDGKGGYEVLNNPSDDLVVRFTENDAKKTVENSTTNLAKFKYKEIPQ